MALLLTHNELIALTRSPTEVVRALDAVEASVVGSHRAGPGQVIFGDLALDGDAYMKVMGASAPAAGMSLQVFPAQTNVGMHPDQRLLLLFDAATASLQALLAGDELNALRTSVPAALGVRHLAPPGSTVLGILGSGYQAASHALTFTAAAPRLRTVLVWSPTPASRERFAAEQTQRLGVPVKPCDSPEEVVRSAHVLTATGRTAPGSPAYAAEWVKPGALVVSMTGSAPPELTRSARLVVPTRRRPELVAFGFNGPAAPRPPAVPDDAIELIDVMEGRTAPRDVPERRVVWELANVYLWDLAIARWAYDWAVRGGVGHAFALSGAPTATAA
jgi:ornithine cyclodeaminase/alanine dehydrogenase-like protein (mu-crystallin family)